MAARLRQPPSRAGFVVHDLVVIDLAEPMETPA
jgi:hypothetical protein